MAQKGKLNKGVKTLIKGTGLSSFGDNSNMAAVDVKNGKLIRIRPFHYFLVEVELANLDELRKQYP